MLSKNDIKKVARKILKQQQGKRSVQIMHPKRDWAIGVLVAIVLVFGTTAWSAVKYIETRNTISAGIEVETEGVTVYRESNVEKALSIFSGRNSLVQSLTTPAFVEVPVATSTDETSTSSIPLTESSAEIGTSTSEQE